MLSQNGLWKNKLGYCMIATMKVTAITVKDFAAWRMKNAKTLLDLEMHPDHLDNPKISPMKAVEQVAEQPNRS